MEPMEPLLIDLRDMDKAEVLAALYNASRPLGMGFVQYDPAPMTREEAAGYLAWCTSFDYLKGRVMKIDLSKDALNPRLYDRDNGEGAAWRAITALRVTGKTNDKQSEDIHKRGVLASADEAKEFLATESTLEKNVFTLGGRNVAETVAPAVERAVEQAKKK